MTQHQHPDSLIDWDAQVSLKLLVETAPIALAVVDSDGRILYVNSKLEELFGYDRQDLLGEAIELLMPNRFHGVHVQHRRGYMQHPRERAMGSGMDLAGRRKDGSEFPLEVGLSHLKVDQGIVVIATITDISRRKHIEELLEQRVEERTREIERRRQVADGLRYILSMLNSNQTLYQVLDYIAHQAMELLGAQACVFDYLHAEDRQLVAVAAQGFEVLHSVSFSPIEDVTARTTFLNGQPIVIDDLACIPGDDGSKLSGQWQALLEQGCRALLAVPLFVKNEVNGSLVLYYTQGHEFLQEEIELAETLSNQAALAIENARLRTQIERTAVTEERNRLARDLHDAVTQTLFSSSMIAEVLPRIWQRNAAEGERRLAELRELTRGALAEMRTLLLELRPAKLVEIDIADLLRQLAEAIAGRARVAVSVQIEGDAELPVDVKIAFYRIAQEALNNVSKHAQAQQALIHLKRFPRRFELTITDDGSGFVFDRIRPQHLGLGIMRERADAIGATLDIQSQPGQGTRIAVRWSK